MCLFVEYDMFLGQNSGAFRENDVRMPSEAVVVTKD